MFFRKRDTGQDYCMNKKRKLMFSWQTVSCHTLASANHRPIIGHFNVMAAARKIYGNKKSAGLWATRPFVTHTARPDVIFKALHRLLLKFVCQFQRYLPTVYSLVRLSTSMSHILTRRDVEHVRHLSLNQCTVLKIHSPSKLCSPSSLLYKRV